MTERWKGAVFLPAGLALVVGALYAAHLTHAFIGRSVTAPGLVVAEPYGVHHPQVRFTTRDGETRTYPQGGEVTQHIGDHVRVRYDPVDPLSTPTLDTFGALWGTALGLAAMGGLFTFGGALLLRLAKTQGASAPPKSEAARVGDEPPASTDADADYEALCASLPRFVCDAFSRRNMAFGRPPPRTAAEMFEGVQGWMIGAGVAEGRGGYPGGRGKPGWPEYVEEQRRNVEVLRALVHAFGAPSPSVADTLRDYDESFPSSKRLMGDGYEPHVDDVAGRLIYSLPVDSGIVSTSFSFPIASRDLDVLLADAWRRAVLETVAHTVLQRSMIRGEPEVTEIAFGRLKDGVLHSKPDELSSLILEVGNKHGIEIEHYAKQALSRQSARERIAE